MADAYTEHFNFVKPEVGGSRDVWGDKWNANLDALDTLIFTKAPLITPNFTGNVGATGTFYSNSSAVAGFQANHRDNWSRSLLLYGAGDGIHFMDTGLGINIASFMHGGDSLVRGSPIITTANMATYFANYVQKTAGNFTGQIDINNASPQINLRDTDHTGAAIHVNSNTFYIFNTPVNSGALSAAMMTIDLTTAAVSFPGAIYPAQGVSSTGDINITKANPRVSFNYPGAHNFTIGAQSDGSFLIYNTATGANWQINSGGGMYTNQMGDVYNHIENRAYAHAVGQANSKLADAATQGGSDLGIGVLGRWDLNTAYGVITGLSTNAYQGVNTAHSRNLFKYSPNSGWTVFGAI